jgi:hypothetical protein
MQETSSESRDEGKTILERVSELLDLDFEREIRANDLEDKISNKIRRIKDDTHSKFMDEFISASKPYMFAVAGIDVAIIALCTKFISPIGIGITIGLASACLLTIAGFKIGEKIFDRKYGPIEEILGSLDDPKKFPIFKDLSNTVQELLKSNYDLQQFKELIYAGDESVASLLQTQPQSQLQHQLQQQNVGAVKASVSNDTDLNQDKPNDPLEPKVANLNQSEDPSDDSFSSFEDESELDL